MEINQNDEIETEENEEIPKKQTVWDELMSEYNEKRQQIEEYKKLKFPKPDPPPTHPIVEYFNERVFPLLNESLTEVLKIVKEHSEEIMPEDYHFNALDFISEYLWNMNPLYPDRKSNWTELKHINWR